MAQFDVPTKSAYDQLEQDVNAYIDRTLNNRTNIADAFGEIQVLRAALSQLNLKWTEVTKSGDGSSTTFTLSHPLSSTPGLAQVQARSSGAEGAYVSNRTSSNVEVTFPSAPSDGASLVFGLLVGTSS